MADITPADVVPYGEDSRKYRRTVYTHEEWVKHRSSDRFVRNLMSLTKSGVYTSLAKEVVATTTIATIVVLWNMIFVGYDDFLSVHHESIFANSVIPALGLPLIPFTLSSPSLGLLLVFRTNSSYGRWDEARKNWGMNINHTRDLVRMGTTWYDPKYGNSDNIQFEQDISLSPSMSQQALPPRPTMLTMTPEEQTKRLADLKELSLATWAFVRSMKRHLSPPAEDEEDFKAELYTKLPPGQAEAIINAAHRPNRALFDLSLAIEKLPMHFMRKNEMQSALSIFEDTLGSSERLLSSPVPLFYSRHTARFLSVWLLMLPFALYEPFKGSWNHIAMIPAMAVISVFLFGIDELAIQLEEPFTILPMQAFCDKIGNWCNEITSWTPGDNE